MSVIRWKFDIGGTYEYEFPRNPDRYGGDTFWRYEARLGEFNIIGSNVPHIQVDGFTAYRTIRFTAVTGNMMRTLRNFFQREAIINNCQDHLNLPEFNCFVIEFYATLHPTTGDFPGSGEDTYDLEITLVKM